MWTLPDHPGASQKYGLTIAHPGMRQNLPDVKIQKKNFFQTIIFAHMYGKIGHLMLEGS